MLKSISQISLSYSLLKTTSYDGYYEVTGYEVSLDGGQTFNVSLDKTVTEYKINKTEFCNVVVRERNSSGREVSQSNSLCFDGGLSGDDLASFDIDEYANTVEIGSCKDFEINALFGLSYGIDTNSFKGATSGVLKANIPTYASIKITFAPPNAACFAALEPAGPEPTTITSVSIIKSFLFF